MKDPRDANATDPAAGCAPDEHPPPSWPDPLLTPLSRRRTLLAGLAGGLSVLAGSALLVPWLRIFLTPADRGIPEVWRPVGSLDDFPVGDTLQVTYRDAVPLPWAGFAARNAAWVRRDADGEFVAFSSYCTHVACPIRWEAEARLFFCPCHGGAFHEDGSVAAGPPPRPLDRYPIRVRDGVVEIRTIGVPGAS